MPPRNTSLDSDSSNNCIYCGEYVPPTRTTPRQKSAKSKVQSTKCTESPFSGRIRKRKMLVEKLANRSKPYPVKRRQEHKRKPKKQMQVPIETNKRCTDAPLSQPGGVPMMASSQLGAMPEEGELSPMLTGIILGLRLGLGYNQDMAAGTPINWDQFQELLHATPSRLNLLQEMQTLAENLARQSSRLSPETSFHGAQGISSIPLVINSPSTSLEGPPSWHEGSAQAKDLTSICSQSDSRVLQASLVKLSNRNIVPGKGAALSHLGSVPSQSSVQVKDQMLKPDDETVQKSEVCLNEKKSQIISEDNNVEDCHPKPTQNE